MRRTLKIAIVLLGVTVVAAFAVSPAAAELGPIDLVSASPLEQADDASAPAISADGRYVAFQGTLGGVTGVFRKRLSDGQVDLVAGRDAYAGTSVALAPSISADGRYVSFTTNVSLDPVHDSGERNDVYVRDMTVAAPGGGPCAPGASCAYELASALDGVRTGLSYSGAQGSAAAGSGGSNASGRVALSADGRMVAFVTTAASNLASDAAHGTPAGQVVFRDLDGLSTTLVSTTLDDGTGAPTGIPVPGGAVRSTPSPGLATNSPLGAALSADGSTVAWMGVHIPVQVPTLPDEAAAIDALDALGDTKRYSEPLWRRVADGPGARTRRIVGGGDPLAPGCPPGGSLATQACQGPFPGLVDNWVREQGAGWLAVNSPYGVPQLSADGRTVALIGNPTVGSNVFVVDMRDGLTRGQAIRRLTREFPFPFEPMQYEQSQNVFRSGDIFDLAVSPDGNRIAFVTARSLFPLAPPNLIGPPLGQIEARELYRIDLERDALERVTGGIEGGPSRGGGLGAPGASAPSFTARGDTLAFASRASNLVAGDANGGGDVFVVADRATSDLSGTVAISPPPPGVSLRPRWRLTAHASTRADGSVRIEVVVPGKGTLRVRARATVRLPAKRSARGRRGARHTRFAVRRVAGANRRARAGGSVVVGLRPLPRYRTVARSRAGLEASVRIAFAAPGRPVLRDELDVRFRVKRKPVKQRGRAGANPKRGPAR